MTVLITGSSGFIGSNVVQSFLDAGHKVIATGRSDKNARKCSWYDQLEFIEHDMSDRSEIDLYKKFKEPGLAVHLAWTDVVNYNSIGHIEKGIFDNFYFLQNLIKNGLGHICVTGTCFEYGLQNGELTEDMPVYPVTNYGIAKNCLRIMLEALQTNYGFKMQWLRLFYTYGKGQSERSIISQLEKAIANKQSSFDMSPGDQVRDYLPVEEMGKIVCKIASQDKVTGIINCCSGKPLSLIEFIEMYMKKKEVVLQLNLGVYSYKMEEPMAFWGNTDKMNRCIKGLG